MFLLLTRTEWVNRHWSAREPPVCALILNTHCSSGPLWPSIQSVIQLPGREACAASKSDNNQPGLEISGLLLRQQSVSPGRALCSCWPRCGVSRQLFLECFLLL